jgi:hypothetical protein
LRRVAIAFILSALAILTACGSSNNSQSDAAPLSGNWAITLDRHAVTDPQTFSGFLVQSGNAISGSVILGDGCQGVGPVTGTLDSQKLSMTINEFGQEVSLVGDVPSGNGFISGSFSTLPGGCTQFPNTGTWSARLIPPVGGNFHGTLTSTKNGIVNVTGNLGQGPNTGASNATITGNIVASAPQQFCAYLTSATISGVISGTQATLNLFGPDGVQTTQIDGTLTPDSTSLTGPYVFQRISNSCFGDQGTLQITFP